MKVFNLTSLKLAVDEYDIILLSSLLKCRYDKITTRVSRMSWTHVRPTITECNKRNKCAKSSIELLEWRFRRTIVFTLVFLFFNRTLSIRRRHGTIKVFSIRCVRLVVKQCYYYLLHNTSYFSCGVVRTTTIVIILQCFYSDSF